MNLEAALRDLGHADPRVRAQAADALGRAPDGGEAAAIEALVAAAGDAHPAVRYAALLSLGELAALSSVEVVAERIHDGEALVREAAAIALGDLGVAAIAPPASAALEVAWAALARALASALPELRFQAIASLVEISAERAAPLVRPMLDDPDPKVRAQAAAALGDARDSSSAEALKARLGDLPEVRHEVALALARLGDRAAVPPLVAALHDGGLALDAATSLAALGVGGDPEAIAALAALVARFFGDALVKVRAAEALARAGDPRGRPHLERAARSRREDVRGLAESVLSDLGDE